MLGKFCGGRIPETVTSSSNLMWVEFRSDHTQSRGGFAAVYYAGNQTAQHFRWIYERPHVLGGLFASLCVFTYVYYSVSFNVPLPQRTAKMLLLSEHHFAKKFLRF